MLPLIARKKIMCFPVFGKGARMSREKNSFAVKKKVWLVECIGMPVITFKSLACLIFFFNYEYVTSPVGYEQLL